MAVGVGVSVGVGIGVGVWVAVGDGVAVGVGLAPEEGGEDLPSDVSPQQTGVPPCVMAQVWVSPALIAENTAPPGGDD